MVRTAFPQDGLLRGAAPVSVGQHVSVVAVTVDASRSRYSLRLATVTAAGDAGAEASAGGDAVAVSRPQQDKGRDATRVRGEKRRHEPYNSNKRRHRARLSAN